MHRPALCDASVAALEAFDALRATTAHLELVETIGDLMEPDERTTLIRHLCNRRALLIGHIAASLAEVDRAAEERERKAWAKADIDVTFDDDGQ